MKFDYFKFPIEKKSEIFGYSILKPIIPIMIISGAKNTTYAALIDSGADFCIFDAEIGEYLGLDIKSGLKENFGGIQDRSGAEAYFHEVDLSLGGNKFRTSVGFSYDIAKHGYGILGQIGFFEKFIVKFDYSKERIEITEKK